MQRLQQFNSNLSRDSGPKSLENPSWNLVLKDENPVFDYAFGRSHGHSMATQESLEFDPDLFSVVFFRQMFSIYNSWFPTIKV